MAFALLTNQNAFSTLCHKSEFMVSQLTHQIGLQIILPATMEAGGSLERVHPRS